MKALEQQMCALKELITTEKKYVQDLEVVVNNYIRKIDTLDIPMPDDLQGDKWRMVFGNLEAIYEWHRE